MWIRKLALESSIIFPESVLEIYVDNQGCISIVNNGYLNERTKHIDVKYNLAKEKVRDNTISLKYVPTARMAADIFTKLLTKEKHRANQRILGMTLPG